MSEIVQSMAHEIADPQAAGKLHAARARTIQLACVLGAACIAASVWAWMPMRVALPRMPQASTPTLPAQTPTPFRTEGFEARAWRVATPVAVAAPVDAPRPQVQLVGLMHDATTNTHRAALYDIALGQLELLAPGDVALCGWTLTTIDTSGVTLTRADTPGDLRLEMERSDAGQSPELPSGGARP